MEGLTHFCLLTLPHHPHHLPPACPPLIHAIRDIIVAVKQVTQNPAVLAS